MDKVDKIKTLLNKKIERRPTFGTDPNEPWSVRAGITESNRGMLDRYLMSRGINPKFLSKYTRISHAKSSSFQQWKRDHMVEENGVDESKTLQHTPVELRQHAINREKHMTKVLTHNGLHKEESLNKKTPTVEDLAKKYNVSEEEIQKELDKGIKVEMEHTSDKKVAREIALDHLGEKIDYYKKLIKFVEEKEQLDELSPGTLSSYVLKTTSKDPKRAEPRKKAMSKLAKIMAKQPVDPKAPKYLPMGEAKTIQGTALDKFRQAAAERARKHADVEKEMKVRHAAGKEDMKGAIDRLEKHLNKEETLNELNYDTVKSLYKKRRDDFHGDQVGKKKKGKEVSAKNVSRSISRLMGFKPTQKEEVEQIDEISKSTLASYKDKSSVSMKNAQVNRDAAEPGKNMSKGFADLHAKSNAIVKKRVKGLIGYMQRKQGMKPTSEDVFQDTYAATQTAFDMGTQADDREPVYSKKKEMSKSARMIKSLYKKNKMVKEELYDHEKEDKSVASYGKKPKVEKQEVYDDDQAAMVLSGGKTLTGQTRDTLEIDPVLRKPNKPDNKQQINKQQ